MKPELAAIRNEDSQGANLRAWIIAARPKTLSAAVAPVLVAAGVVHSMSIPVSVFLVSCLLLASLSIQIATNFFNDAIDFEKGADKETRLGPQRVTQSGLMTVRQVKLAALSFILIAVLASLPLVVAGGWPILVIGLISIALTYAYTGGPFPLAYLGLGDLFVILFFGLIAVGGSVFVLAHELPGRAWVAGLQVGLLATSLIAINNLRDRSEDAKVGKKTLAVRWGETWMRFEIAALTVLPFLLGSFYLREKLNFAAYLPLAAVPLATRLVRAVSASKGTEFNQVLAKAGALQIVFGILLMLGFWLSV